MKTVLACLAGSMLAHTALAQQSVYWPPQFSIGHSSCSGSAAAATLTVHGRWFCPAVPTGAHATVQGTNVTVVVEWAYTSPPPCAAVVTPWSRDVALTGLAPGAQYRVVAEFQGPLTLAPQPIGSFTASCCAADFDDGSGEGHTDGAVTIDDLLYYLPLFAAGSTAADLDDGSGTGHRDGGVTIDDLLYYLRRFGDGC